MIEHFHRYNVVVYITTNLAHRDILINQHYLEYYYFSL